MSVIDEVKQRTDIVEVASQYTKLTKAGRNFKGICPFHSEKHPSFFIYPEQQSWHCFGACNTGGDVFSFVMKQQNISFGDALRLLAEKAGVAIPSGARQEADKERYERLYQANEAASQYFHNLLLNSPAGEKARNYVAQRALSEETVAHFQLGYSLNSWDSLKQYLMERVFTESELAEAGLIIEVESGASHDRFRNLLMFPIFNARGRITGFGARALDDSLPKYINSPQTPIFDKSGNLYAINLAAPEVRQQNSAVLVEGYTDVITAHQNGFSNVVASMGTSVTEKQIDNIKRLSKNVTLALDADAAGEEAMLRCVGYENTLDAEIKVAILPSGRDPDDVIREDATKWQNLLEQAMPVVDYTLNMVTAELDLTKAKDKTLAVGKLLPIIAEIKDPVRQAHYLQKLAGLVKVNERTLEAALSKVKPKQVRGKFEKPKPEPSTHLLVSSPLEEYCLALLLQHPELRSHQGELLPEYFENSENRETFIALKQTNNIDSVKENLDSTIWEHLDCLMKKNLPSDKMEQKLANCILRLQESFLRGLEMKREAIFASEAASKGSNAELTKLEEQGIEVSAQLREVFIRRAGGGHKQRRNG
jgi:DNA primase